MPTQEEMEAHFERAADTYESSAPLMRDFAREALALLPPLTAASVLHDNASGPGIVSAAALAAPQPPAAIHATDLSPAMIRVLRAKPALASVRAEVMDATALTFADETFTHSATNFALMALTVDDAAKAAGHLHRTLKPGGAAEVATWARLGYIDMVTEVVQAAKPGAPPPRDVPLPDYWREEATLVDALVKGGFDREKITVVQRSREVGGDSWTGPSMQPMVDMVEKQCTQGWTDAEKQAFRTAWAERTAAEKANPKMYTMTAHMAVARK